MIEEFTVAGVERKLQNAYFQPLQSYWRFRVSMGAESANPRRLNLDFRRHKHERRLAQAA